MSSLSSMSSSSVENNQDKPFFFSSPFPQRHLASSIFAPRHRHRRLHDSKFRLLLPLLLHLFLLLLFLLLLLPLHRLRLLLHHHHHQRLVAGFSKRQLRRPWPASSDDIPWEAEPSDQRPSAPGMPALTRQRQPRLSPHEPPPPPPPRSSPHLLPAARPYSWPHSSPPPLHRPRPCYPHLPFFRPHSPSTLPQPCSPPPPLSQFLPPLVWPGFRQSTTPHPMPPTRLRSD